MKARTLIILWMACAVLVPALGAVGALFKVEHWPRHWVFDGVAFTLSMVVAIAIGIKILRYPGFKDFLDR